MAYLHYTRNPITYLKDEIPQHKYAMKPIGLWLSQGEEWREWCEKEEFSTCNLDTCAIYSANIKKDTLAVIDSLYALNEFHKKYEKGDSYIDWIAVAHDYDGICFENYYDVKRDYLYTSKSIYGIWILGIDVNSACIWNPSKVLTDLTCERTAQTYSSQSSLAPIKVLNDIRQQVHGTVQ